MPHIINHIQDSTIGRRHMIREAYDAISRYVLESRNEGMTETPVSISDLVAVMRALEVGHDELIPPTLEMVTGARLQGEFYRQGNDYFIRLEVPGIFIHEFDLDNILENRTWGLFVYSVIAEMRRTPYFWSHKTEMATVIDWVKYVIDMHFSVNDKVPDFIVHGGRVSFNVETVGDPECNCPGGCGCSD